MKEVIGNLWDFYDKDNFTVCITTNGFVKKNHESVMGRGCAKEAKERFPLLPLALGRSIEEYGNIFTVIHDELHHIKVGIFPVKTHWMLNADLELIRESAKQLKSLALFRSNETFILPRPGCGNGFLQWEDVKPVIEFLPDNVWVISKG